MMRAVKGTTGKTMEPVTAKGRRIKSCLYPLGGCLFQCWRIADDRTMDAE
jgi:hypothetical protein